jgi:hypothetical protein
MTAKERYDAIVIGAGQAGTPLSTTLAQAEWKTALIEREHVGGTCVNEGCAPTKTMVASARVAYLVQRTADYGVHTGPVTVDMAKVRQHKRAIVESFRSGSQRRIERTEGLDLLMGEARLLWSQVGERSARINSGETRLLTADEIFINTGARPRKPSLPGLDSVSALDSTSIMELDEVPGHLLPNVGWRLSRGGIRPDVPPLWQPGDHCATERAARRSPAKIPMWPKKYLARLARGWHRVAVGEPSAARRRDQRWTYPVDGALGVGRRLLLRFPFASCQAQP